MPDQSSASCALQPSTRLSTQGQQLIERGPHDTLVQHSPYGQSRNTAYGWGNLFQRPLSAIIPDHPFVHIGISSLNGVPTVGRSDRSMRSLLSQYRKKFNCLEHCYPYHKVGDTETWRAWANMVKDSNASNNDHVKEPKPARVSLAQAIADTLNADVIAAESTSLRPLAMNDNRFLYAIKANNFLTHVKQLNMEDAEVVEHVHIFFRERCVALEPFLGPVLVQLPPSFGYSSENMHRLTRLYQALSQEETRVSETMPQSCEAVSSSDTSSTPVSGLVARQRWQRLRIAVEFRNRSWFREETFALLGCFRWALVVAHHHDDPTYAQVVDTGAGFLYIRLHGPLGRNVGDYGPMTMRLWAEEILRYLRPETSGAVSGAVGSAPCGSAREVFVFLNNSDSHVSGTASSVVDATCLAEQLRGLLQCASSTVPSANSSTECGVPLPDTESAVVAGLQRNGKLSVSNGDRRRSSEKIVESERDVLPAKRQRTALRGPSKHLDDIVID